MDDSLAGIALGAGAGDRLRPLTTLRPKVLCPVGNTPLIDHAIGRLRTVTTSIAVNAHDSQPALIEHLEGAAGPLRVSVETGERLGTAGPLAQLREWIDGRATVVVNGDTWCPGSLAVLLEGWDGSRIRILVPGGGPFGPQSRIAGALMPWDEVRRLHPTPTGLWEVSWRRAHEEGRIESVACHGPFMDCATPADYLAANLAASGGHSVVGDGAAVHGQLDQCVVWPGSVVRESERLRRAIRAERVTVLVRDELPLIQVDPAG